MPAAALANASPMYDAVLVDEYQDFHDDWFRLCKKICRTHPDGKGGNEEAFGLPEINCRAYGSKNPSRGKASD